MRDVISRRVHRVALKYKYGITRSVFVRARGTAEAEQLALKRNPSAVGIDRRPNS